MTLSEFRAATANLPADTQILSLDLCGLLSPAVILDPAELVDDDPALDAVIAAGPALILTSEPV